jgi:predicted phage terminase large subunit-like protein
LLIIDDPIKSREVAFSESARQKLHEWFISDLLPRLRPNAKVVLISTRWHEDDLFGRLAVTNRYRVISLPAVAETEDDPLGRKPGEFLWSEDPRYPYNLFLEAQRESQLPSSWSALFQQRPAPEEGDYFRSDWFKPTTAMPARESLSIYGASDYAVSAGKGDFTVHVVVGLDPEGQLYLLDLWRRQADTAVSVDAYLDLAKQWRVIGWAQETGQINSAIGPFLRERMRTRNTYVATETFPTKGDKTVRAQSIRGRLAVGGIFVPTHADWWPDVRSELLSFPAAKHDDCADALGLIGQILDKMFAPSAPKPNEPPKVLSTDPALCSVTLGDLFTANERSHRRASTRIW